MQSAIKRLLTHGNMEERGNIRLIDTFLNCLDTEKILFYPSSGFDVTDIRYVNEDRLVELNGCTPTIFIHCDYLHTKDSEYNIGTSLYPSHNGFQFLPAANYCILVKGEYKSITVVKINKPGFAHNIWLIHFGGYFNEEILEILINSRKGITHLYSVCDGIASGMGYCSEFSIPTIFYPFFYNQLKVKFHVTEYSHSVITDFINYRESKQLRKWLNNILMKSNNPFVTELLTFNDEDLRAHLLVFLLGIPELKINSEESLRIYDSRYWESFHLKIIPGKGIN